MSTDQAAGPPLDVAGLSPHLSPSPPRMNRGLSRSHLIMGRFGDELRVASLWLISRAAIVLVAVGYAVATAHSTGSYQRVTGLFAKWDSDWYRMIAAGGYKGGQVQAGRCCGQAFFPGYPLLIRALTPLTRSDVTAGLVISLIAGAVTAIMLYRITADQAARTDRSDAGWPRIAGNRAVFYLAVAPTTIFLSAVYSEALFLAFATSAWWLATRGRWWWAGALAAGASATRINGLFLLAGLFALYVVETRRVQGRVLRTEGLSLVLPVLPVLAFFAYLRVTFGSWSTWFDAEQGGWHRGIAWPWQGWANSWHLMQAAPPWRFDLVLSWYEEFGAVVIGVALIVVLARRRQWPELTYVAVSALPLIFASSFYSVPRAALLWFPGFTIAALATTRPRGRWLHVPLIVVSVLLAGTATAIFTSRLWVS
jgi:Gpi18-like mannosyltransferase